MGWDHCFGGQEPHLLSLRTTAGGQMVWSYQTCEVLSFRIVLTAWENAKPFPRMPLEGIRQGAFCLHFSDPAAPVSAALQIVPSVAKCNKGRKTEPHLHSALR
jgi:hypothetical protein